MRARRRTAFRLGCHLAVTETGEPMEGTHDPSYRNMLRHGFEPRGRRID